MNSAIPVLPRLPASEEFDLVPDIYGLDLTCEHPDWMGLYPLLDCASKDGPMSNAVSYRINMRNGQVIT